MDTNWLNLVGSDDSQGLAKWISVGIGVVMAWLGLSKWYEGHKLEKAKRKAQDIAAIAGPILEQVEACHGRLNKFKEIEEIRNTMVEKQLTAIQDEQTRARNTAGTIFDYMRTNDEKSETRARDINKRLDRIVERLPVPGTQLPGKDV